MATVTGQVTVGAQVIPVTASVTLPSAGTWLSGQSDPDTTADGSFAAWRGRPVEIGGAWASNLYWAWVHDCPDWSVGPGSTMAGVPALDWAITPWPTGEGSCSWAQAAAGAYDSHWSEHLDTLKIAWGSRDPAKLFLRFAWEMNGSWFPWRVQPGEQASFITAWRRFAALARAKLPRSPIVWCCNAGSSYAYSVASLWPGDAYVDVVGLDAYNWWPWVNSQATWQAKIVATENGGPKQLESFRLFAAARSKPMCVPEWSNVGRDTGGGGGDAPVYVSLFHDWLTANAGTGSGQVVYEVLFNWAGRDEGFAFYPQADSPLTAANYRQLWAAQ